MVYVHEHDGPGMFEGNALRVYREMSVPTGLAVRIVHPGPDRTLLAGSVRFVRWATTVPVGQTATIDLELSATGPGGPFIPVAAGLPDSGRYQWTVPPEYSESCHLRITATTSGGTVSTVSTDPFTIAGRPDSLELQIDTGSRVHWSDSLGRQRYNLYRGYWQRFTETGELTQDPALVPEANRWCNLESSEQVDTFTPAPGRMVYYLVTGFRMVEDGQETGVAVPMAESPLGQDSNAVMRVNSCPCPEPGQ
jgi:hypothetical protein